LSGDNSLVNSITVVVMAISIPTALLAFAALIQHFFILHRPLDGPAVQLFGLLLGGGAGGGWAISRATMFTQVSGMGLGGGITGLPAPPQEKRDRVKPAPPESHDFNL